MFSWLVEKSSRMQTFGFGTLKSLVPKPQLPTQTSIDVNLKEEQAPPESISEPSIGSSLFNDEKTADIIKSTLVEWLDKQDGLKRTIGLQQQETTATKASQIILQPIQTPEAKPTSIPVSLPADPVILGDFLDASQNAEMMQALIIVSIVLVIVASIAIFIGSIIAICKYKLKVKKNKALAG